MPKLRVCNFVGASIVVLSVIVPPLGAQSQNYEYEFGAGVVIPTGILGRDRGAWPLVRAGVQRRAPTKRIGVRLDGEFFSMPGSAAPADPLTSRGSLTSVGVLMNAIVRTKPGKLSPYALVGVGIHWLRSEAPDTYPGGLVGLRIGTGVRANVGSLKVVAEVAAQAAILSSYGSVKSPKVGAYCPITIGLRF